MEGEESVVPIEKSSSILHKTILNCDVSRCYGSGGRILTDTEQGSHTFDIVFFKPKPNARVGWATGADAIGGGVYFNPY